MKKTKKIQTVQMFYLKLKDKIKPDEKVIGDSFIDEDSNTINGFIFDFFRDSNIAGVCLFEPVNITLTKDVKYYEDRVSYIKYMKKMFAANPSCINKWKEKCQKR